jgi:hypothetical protein
MVEVQDQTDNPDQGQPIIPVLDLDAAQANAAAGAAVPAPGAAAPGTAAPGMAPGAGPRAPFSAPWQPAMPTFPQAASYPAWR